MKGGGKLIAEIAVVVIMCAACMCGMYYFLGFADVPQEARKPIVVFSSVLTAVGVTAGYWIRFRRNTLFWPERAPGGGERRHVFLRSATMSIIVIVGMLCGIYLVLNSSWELGVLVFLLSALLSLVQLKWLSSIRKNQNTGGKRL